MNPLKLSGLLTAAVLLLSPFAAATAAEAPDTSHCQGNVQCISQVWDAHYEVNKPAAREFVSSFPKAALGCRIITNLVNGEYEQSEYCPPKREATSSRTGTHCFTRNQHLGYYSSTETECTDFDTGKTYSSKVESFNYGSHINYKASYQ